MACLERTVDNTDQESGSSEYKGDSTHDKIYAFKLLVPECPKIFWLSRRLRHVHRQLDVDLRQQFLDLWFRPFLELQSFSGQCQAKTPDGPDVDNRGHDVESLSGVAGADDV
jgi:hypothetical protein